MPPPGQQPQIDEITKTQQATALILERIVGRVEVLEKWKDSEERARERAEDRRENHDEQRPETLRSMFSTYGGCLSQLLYAAMCSLSVLIALSALLLTLIHGH
jgi:hypothetical protein